MHYFLQDQVKYWCEEIKQAGSIGIKAILEETVLFVVEISGEFFRLLVETVEELAKMFSLIWDKVLNA